jgi:hypothetical protein
MLRIGGAVVAPAERAAGVSAVVGFGTVQQGVLVVVLVAAMVGVAVVVVVGGAVCGLDVGAPGVVLGRLAADVVRVRGGGFVGQDAFAQELGEVVAGYGGGEGEDDTNQIMSASWGW